MRGSAGGLEKLSAGVSGLVKKTLDCTVHTLMKFEPLVIHGATCSTQDTAYVFQFLLRSNTKIKLINLR